MVILVKKNQRKLNIKYNKTGIRLANRRRELKYTQPKLGEMIGVTKNHISNFEHGGSVSLEVLLDLCDALEITPDYLLFGTIRESATDDLLDLVKLCDDYEISILSDLAEAMIKRRNNKQ